MSGSFTPTTQEIKNFQVSELKQSMRFTQMNQKKRQVEVEEKNKNLKQK